MIDQDRAFKVVKKLMPNAPDDKIKAGIANLAKAHPELTDDQAFILFVQAIQQNKQKLSKNMNLKSYLSNPLLGGQ
jgi:hypothetical protein